MPDRLGTLSLQPYFSASSNTGALAAHLAKAADADLFRIEPVDPYTEADLRWTNPLARCNREKIGKKDVPISGRVDNWGEYECVFIGFPVWYYGAPNIIETFVKSYDFTGKKYSDKLVQFSCHDTGTEAREIDDFISETYGRAGEKKNDTEIQERNR